MIFWPLPAAFPKSNSKNHFYDDITPAANVSPRFPPFGPHLSLESSVEAEKKFLPVDFLWEFRILHAKNLFYDREKFQFASPSILHRSVEKYYLTWKTVRECSLDIPMKLVRKELKIFIAYLCISHTFKCKKKK